MAKSVFLKMTYREGWCINEKTEFEESPFDNSLRWIGPRVKYCGGHGYYNGWEECRWDEYENGETSKQSRCIHYRSRKITIAKSVKNLEISGGDHVDYGAGCIPWEDVDYLAVDFGDHEEVLIEDSRGD